MLKGLDKKTGQPRKQFSEQERAWQRNQKAKNDYMKRNGRRPKG